MNKETLIKLAQPTATLVLALCVLSIPSRIYFPDHLNVHIDGGALGVDGCGY